MLFVAPLLDTPIMLRLLTVLAFEILTTLVMGPAPVPPVMLNRTLLRAVALAPTRMPFWKPSKCASSIVLLVESNRTAAVGPVDPDDGTVAVSPCTPRVSSTPLIFMHTDAVA